MTHALRLTVVTGPHRGERFYLRDRAHYLMGRSPECSVRLAGTPRDRAISRRHCELTLDDHALTIRDLDSRFGTYLDGERIESATLPMAAASEALANEFDQGALLTVGGTTLRMNLVDRPSTDSLRCQDLGSMHA